MKLSPQTIPIEMYIAIDSHKHYVTVGGMRKDHQWTLRPRKVQMVRFRDWAAKNLEESDAVVLETTANVWDIYDIVAPLVNKTVVTNAYKVRQIAEVRVKTDKEDVKRFSHPKKLVGYAGLGVGVHVSGQKLQEKSITKQGRKELRWILVQAAWGAVRSDPY